jgi:hypothetical protein
MLEPGRLAFLDDQRPDQATAEFLGAADVRVVPVAAGVRHAEFVVEVLARLDRQLRHIGHAVHFQRQADAVPMDGGFHRQVVDEAHPQPGALAHSQLGARRRRAEGPGLGLETRHQLDVQRGGDQLVVVPGVVVLDLAQPVTRRASGAQAYHNQAGQAFEHLSTGKGHRCGYLVSAQSNCQQGWR